jgi:hypothetical protein
MLRNANSHRVDKNWHAIPIKFIFPHDLVRFWKATQFPWAF